MLASKLLPFLPLILPALCDTLKLTSASCDKGVEAPAQCHTGQSDVQECVDSMAQVPVGVTCYTEWTIVSSHISCQRPAVTLEIGDEALVAFSPQCQDLRYGLEAEACDFKLWEHTQFIGPAMEPSDYYFNMIPLDQRCVITILLAKTLYGTNTELTLPQPPEGIYQSGCVADDTIPAECAVGVTDIETCEQAMINMPSGAYCNIKYRIHAQDVSCDTPVLSLKYDEVASATFINCTDVLYGNTGVCDQVLLEAKVLENVEGDVTQFYVQGEPSDTCVVIFKVHNYMWGTSVETNTEISTKETQKEQDIQGHDTSDTHRVMRLGVITAPLYGLMH
eukprot:Blabericola_migrator_1__4283@NODE_2313_length_2950_cov_612_657995_g1449_i0_p2_GENE_NODE_2313_length_2950_cov_612_657995_g1449_i0NODE_2313_length_2950_cov_612_657995_g1449_i0_p2_ORF_typecomplete_len335_score66_28_NODE_2313_length_2950_cov_612_657995_g1449_i05741578